MPRVSGTYRQILSARGAVAFAGAGFVARMAHLMTALGVVFLLSPRTGSYSLAGVVAAAYAITYAVIGPLSSRLVDKLGQGMVLRPAAVATLASRTAFLAAWWLHAPAWSLLALSALSGATMPAVGSLVRARWSNLLRNSPMLHTALSFESVLDEIILVIAPIAVAMLATYLHPSAALITALVLATIGLTALATQRHTEPAPPSAVRAANGTAMPVPALALLILTFVAVTAAASTIELTTIAASQNQGAKALSGWILATLALASAASGIHYGARQRTSSPERRLTVMLTLYAGGTLLFVAGQRVWYLFAAAFLLGLTMAPTLIVGYTLVNHIVPPHRLTEGLTWLTTSAGIGISVGSALAGRIVDDWGTRAAFGTATLYAAVAIVSGLAATNRLSTRPS